MTISVVTLWEQMVETSLNIRCECSSNSQHAARFYCLQTGELVNQTHDALLNISLNLKQSLQRMCENKMWNILVCTINSNIKRKPDTHSYLWWWRRHVTCTVIVTQYFLYGLKTEETCPKICDMTLTIFYLEVISTPIFLIQCKKTIITEV